MDVFKAKYIAYLISFTLIVGAGLGALLFYLFPAYFPNWYAAMLSYFFLYELMVIFAVDYGSKKYSAKKLANLYLLFKVGKILSSLLFVMIYAIAVKVGMKNFVLVFMLLYFFYLLFETLYFSRIEKRIKTQKTIDK